jgi:hypothetical protein
MFRRRWLTAAAALIAGGGIAVSVGILPAVGQSSPPASPVFIGHTATLVARGAAAKSFAYVVCQPGDFVTLQISLTEKVGKRIATGTGVDQGFVCNGLIEKVTVPIPATGTAFTKGVAFGQAYFQDCGFFSCGIASSSGKVSLIK